MSSGSTFLRESASYVLASCELTKLKNHKCPIHITPAARWVQRKMTFSHSFMESPRFCENGGAHLIVCGSIRREKEGGAGGQERRRGSSGASLQRTGRPD